MRVTISRCAQPLRQAQKEGGRETTTDYGCRDPAQPERHKTPEASWRRELLDSVLLCVMTKVVCVC